ncbi:MAG: DUF349 domain-containing protein [Cyclobacteriaceae bacterium]
MEPKNPYGFIKEGKIYRNAFLDYPVREIGEVRESEESTIKYFEDRFQMAENKVKALENAVAESDNKGSYLMKLIHMRTQLANFDALGDYVSLYERLDKIEEDLRDIISKNRVKNLEIKQALLAEAAQYEQSTDWNAATDELQEIKNKWIRTGAVGKEHDEEIEGRFSEILDNFFQRRKQFFEDRKNMINERIDQYRSIIFKLRKLMHEDDKQLAREKVKGLQNEWKEIGKIPPKLYHRFFKDYKYLTAKFFRPAQRPGSSYSSSSNRRFNNRQNFNSRTSAPPPSGAELEQVMEKKRELLSQAQALALREGEDVVEDVKRLKFLWKRTGMVPREVGGSVTYEFNRACDLASEKSFLNRLVRSKNPDYDTEDENRKISIKINLLNNLIVRDERELDLYKENAEKFSSNRYQAGQQVATKLKAQQRKVAVKKALLEELMRDLNSIK